MVDRWMRIKCEGEQEYDITKSMRKLKFLGTDSDVSITNNYFDATGMDGSNFSDATFNKNTINAYFYLSFRDWEDYKLQKHNFLSRVMNKKLMRIRTNAEPAIVQYVRSGNVEIKPFQRAGLACEIMVPFENPSGYKYSLMNSDALYEFDEAGWQIGMNLPTNISHLNYTFHHQYFRVYNASDIQIDPYYQRHELKILSRFKGEFIQLVNLTNGSSWKYDQYSDGNDEVLLDGISTSLNGNPASDKTDYGNITLEPGWNEFKVNGAYWMNILFSFPFIYIG